MSTPLLSISDLSILLPDGADRRHAVADVSMSFTPGKLFALLGRVGRAIAYSACNNGASSCSACPCWQWCY